jgi:ABC-type transport system involved in cytochrome c biogenesis ATPase subunit
VLLDAGAQHARRTGRESLALSARLLRMPANGLDPEGIRWMRDLLRAHADAGGTVLLSSSASPASGRSAPRSPRSRWSPPAYG